MILCQKKLQPHQVANHATGFIMPAQTNLEWLRARLFYLSCLKKVFFYIKQKALQDAPHLKGQHGIKYYRLKYNTLTKRKAKK